MDVKSLRVFLQFGTSKILVGDLGKIDHQIYFRFDSEFLQKRIEISPFRLKTSSEIKACPKDPFDGVFGVFNDSLPDGWGKLLIDRKLIERGIAPSALGAMERLSLLGENTQGALVYEPALDQNQTVLDAVDLEEIAFESLKVLKIESNRFLDQLYALGGNSAGARPKINIYYHELLSEFSVLPTPEREAWMIKFPSLYDLKDSAKIEFAYYSMAKEAGITMSRSCLFEGATGNFYFGTKRFDRIGSARQHFHSASGLLHDNFRVSSIDYGHVMDAANKLENNLHAAIQVFRLAVFNIYSGNMDDHSKNIGFLMDEKGNWKLAPAYDLTFSPKAGGYQSLSVAGSYKDIGKKELLLLAQHFSIRNGHQIIEEIKEILATWKRKARELDIKKKEANLVSNFLERKISMKS